MKATLTLSLVALALTFGVVAGCASPAAPAAAPTADPRAVTEQLARGAPLYAQNCATGLCHGKDSAGIREGNSFRAFPLVGTEFQARNPNAQVVFDVVRSGDEQNLRGMTDQQIYDAVAYELSLNGAKSDIPLTAETAFSTLSGPTSFNPAGIYPPVGDLKLISPQVPPRAHYAAQNGHVALRVDQLAMASAIGNTAPPNNGTFIIVVLALQDLTDHPLDVDPKFVRLIDSQDSRLEPRAIDLASPIERLHGLRIQPEHGTAAIAVFAVTSGATSISIMYDDETGHPLVLSLAK
jgi:mono/diheme cytochrome c family protein